MRKNRLRDNLSFRITIETSDELERAAQATGVSLGEIARRALEMGLVGMEKQTEAST